MRAVALTALALAGCWAPTYGTGEPELGAVAPVDAQVDLAASPDAASPDVPASIDAPDDDGNWTSDDSGWLEVGVPPFPDLPKPECAAGDAYCCEPAPASSGWPDWCAEQFGGAHHARLCLGMSPECVFVEATPDGRTLLMCCP